MPGRRAVLCGAATAAAALAGCGFPSAPMRPVPEPPPYARWLHRPDVGRYAGEEVGDPRYTLSVARPAAVAARTDDVLAAAGERWTSDAVVRRALDRWDVGLLSPSAVDRWVGVREAAPAGDGRAALAVTAAVAGSFDPAAVRERVRDGPAVPAGTHRDYDLVRWPRREQVAAFGDGQVVVARGLAPTGPVRPLATAVEPALDVLAGAAPPTPERDRDLARLVGHLGDGFAVRAARPPGPRFADLEGLVAWGAASVAVEGLRRRWVGVFAGPPPADAVERRLRSGYFIGMDGLERRNRAVVAEGRVDLPVWLG